MPKHYQTSPDNGPRIIGLGHAPSLPDRYKCHGLSPNHGRLDRAKVLLRKLPSLPLSTQSAIKRDWAREFKQLLSRTLKGKHPKGQ